MAERTWQVLILGRLPEARDLFSREPFEKTLPTEANRVDDPEGFETALEQRPTPDVILIDVEPHGMDVLEMVRDHFPVAPVVMVGDPEHAEVLLEALQQGLERYVLRLQDRELFIELLSQVVYRVLQHSVEPPSMDMPSAEEMHRYAQYHHILHPFFVVDPDRRLLYANAAAERLVWKLRDRAARIGERLAVGALAELGEPFERQLQDAIDGRESVIQYSFDRLPEPQERSVHCLPIQTSAGRTVAASVAIHQEIPPEVERTRTMRAISRFAGGLAHDFNNLLNVMMVQTDLLRARLGDVSEPVEDSLESMARAVTNGSALTRRLLAISHESLTHREPVRVNDVIAALKPALESELREGQTLRVDLTDELPPVDADPEQVEQLIKNLVKNSIEALEAAGDITISTSIVGPQEVDKVPRGLENRRWMVVRIEDTGPGVRPSIQSKIFEPFFTTRRAQGHSGLGLTLVHAVVEQVGGRIFIDSEPGQGTRFTIFLPTAEDTQPGAKAEPIQQAPSSDVDRATILLVEDEDELRRPFREALTQRNYHVFAAADAPGAKRLLDEHAHDLDLLITDVVMPGGSGIELVRKAVAVDPELKVIFMSGYTAEVVGDAEETLEGDFVFLSKPVSLTQLTRAVDSLLQTSAESRQADGDTDSTGPDDGTQ